MKAIMTRKTTPTGLAGRGRVVVALVLASFFTTWVLPTLAVVDGATTSSSTTTIRFLVSTDKPTTPEAQR